MDVMREMISLQILGCKTNKWIQINKNLTVDNIKASIGYDS